MKKILILTAVFAVLAAAGFGCAKSPASGDVVLAKVSSRRITAKEFDARIAKMPPYYRSIVERNRRRYLDDMITEMILYEEAVRKGFDRDKEIIDLIKEAKKKIIITKFIKTEVQDAVKVTDEEVRAFYEARKDQFKAPEAWRASHILMPDEKEAKDVLEELSKGVNFEELAKAHSTDATAARGGDIGYFRKGQLIPEFEKECLKLGVGQTSGIVHTQFGYHIIKLTDKKESVPETYDKIKPAIESELKRARRSEAFDKLMSALKKKYMVELNDKVLPSSSPAEAPANEEGTTVK